MSNNKLNIAKTIKVGFNKRSDTYTGMLAYIIYYDEKGVLRKEKSWDSWRDHKIAAQEFANEPTSGFVLNKKVGDYKSDWNHRMAHIRVYDPRGFEFEISVENLLYILQECTSTKGKGLEGEFVYAWDGTTLVLLPTDSVEYQASKVFTDHKLSKVSKADMIPGCVYMNKDMENVLYLGREDYYEFDTNFSVEGYEYCYSSVNRGKKHVFVYTDKNKAGQYWIQTGFTKIASKISDTISTDFPQEFENYKQSFYGSPVTKITFEECEPKISSSGYGWTYLENRYDTVMKKNNKYYRFNDDRIIDNSMSYYLTNEYSVDDCTLRIHKLSDDARRYYYSNSAKETVSIQDLKLYIPTYHNEYGKTHKVR
jgi:hypothetical protein